MSLNGVQKRNIFGGLVAIYLEKDLLPTSAITVSVNKQVHLYKTAAVHINRQVVRLL